MVTTTANKEVVTFLASLTEETVIQDETGEIIGRFRPVDPQEKDLYARARAMIDLEEIKRRKREEKGPGRSLSEILKELHAQEQTG